jgi:hypothetical protein
MKPSEDIVAMAALDFASRFPNRDGALPLHLQAVRLFFEEDVGKPRQGPGTHNGSSAHQLIVIQTQFLL